MGYWVTAGIGPLDSPDRFRSAFADSVEQVADMDPLGKDYLPLHFVLNYLDYFPWYTFPSLL